MQSLLQAFPVVQLSALDVAQLLPLVLLAIGGTLALILGTSKDHQSGHRLSYATSMVTLLASGLGFLLAPAESSVIGDVLKFGQQTQFLCFVLHLAVGLGMMLIYTQSKISYLLSEMYPLAIFSLLGMCLLSASEHLLFQFISIEIMSLAIYIMVAIKKGSKESAEAGLKYFILGGLASGLFLYGSALIFGATGTLTLSGIATSQGPWLKNIGLALVICGLLFKVGAFPFHGWVPDVYQGAILPVTAIMAAAVKMSAFIVLSKVASSALNDASAQQFLHWLITISAVLTMAYGNIVALTQKNLKKLLAYSSIAHTGYLMVGILSLSEGGQSAIYLYLTFYVFTTLGTFAILQLLFPGNEEASIEQLNGVGLSHPLLGGLLTFFFLAMAGIPITSGFIGKYMVFSAGVTAGNVLLVIFAVMTSVVATFYYLRVIVALYFHKSSTVLTTRWAISAVFVAIICGLATLHFGLRPNSLINYFGQGQTQGRTL